MTLYVSSMNRTISQLRERVGLTQAEVAQLVGVSENTIANWEKGGAAKWIRNLNNLCKVLNCKLEDLSQEVSELNPSQRRLTENVCSTVRRYCEASSNHDKKTLIKILSFATLHDALLRYWLDQADEKIKQYQKTSEDKLDIELIINSLVLQNLSQELSLILPYQSTNSSAQPIQEKFNELVAQVHLTQEFLDRYTCFNDNHFCRKLILQNRHLCVYVIGWEPEQKSEIHHHGNSLDAIRVIKGKMNHWLIAPEQWEAKGSVSFEGCLPQGEAWGEEAIIEEGQQVVIDRRYGHQIKNSSGQRLVTLHFRFGSLPEDNYWEPSSESPIMSWSQLEQYQIMST